MLDRQPYEFLPPTTTMRLEDEMYPTPGDALGWTILGPGTVCMVRIFKISVELRKFAPLNPPMTMTRSSSRAMQAHSLLWRDSFGPSEKVMRGPSALKLSTSVFPSALVALPPTIHILSSSSRTPEQLPRRSFRGGPGPQRIFDEIYSIVLRLAIELEVLAFLLLPVSMRTEVGVWGFFFFFCSFWSLTTPLAFAFFGPGLFQVERHSAHSS
mmetsp:Transcript_471/g.1103  ORF Transcript_471/g.1103 Transcript_471/m.1103 type:complete len:212 (+) Transcript_471:810-1445(+)